MSRVLIAGCGDVGTHLGQQLVRAGHHVLGLRRQTELLPDEIEPVRVDLCDPQSVRRLPRSVDYIVYALSPDHPSENAYINAYQRGPRILIEGLRDVGATIKRVVYVSSTRVYSQTNGDWVDEDSKTEAVEFRANALIAGERFFASCGLNAVVLRLAGIYGPGRSNLIRRVEAGTTCRESPPRFTNRIHRDDCVGVLQHLLELRSPGSIYVGVDHCPAPQCEVMDWIAERIGVTRPPREALKSTDRVSNKRCSNRRLIASGYRFRYPTYREGYASVLSIWPIKHG